MTHNKVTKKPELKFFTFDHIGYGLAIYCGFDFNPDLGYLMILFSFFAIIHNYHKACHG